MSKVSSLFIISCGYRRMKENTELINKWFEDNKYGDLIRLSPANGEASNGDKFPQRELMWAGINYLKEDEFISFFKTLEWNGTLLIIGPEDSDNGYKVVLAKPEGPYGMYDSRIDLHIPNFHRYDVLVRPDALSLNEY